MAFTRYVCPHGKTVDPHGHNDGKCLVCDCNSIRRHLVSLVEVTTSKLNAIIERAERLHSAMCKEAEQEQKRAEELERRRVEHERTLLGPSRKRRSKKSKRRTP